MQKTNPAWQARESCPRATANGRLVRYQEMKLLRGELDVPVVHIECDGEGAVLCVTAESAARQE